MEIIFNISNHPVYNILVRKAKLRDMTYNSGDNRILFKLEVKTYLENEVVTDLTRLGQFIADSESTIQEGTSDIDLIMGRILNGDAILTIISDCVAFLDQSGKLNQRLGLI